MHNLHFILIKADSANEAASEAENGMLDWGDENNWRRLGGVASEDGSDDIENHDNGLWGLSYLDKQDGVPKDGTYFSRAVAYLLRRITEPVTDLRSALSELGDRLREFDPDHGDSYDLWAIGRDLKHLSELMDSRKGLKHGTEIPEFYEWQFDHFGLTDMTEDSEGARRYLVFLDMHS
jgi:hypothetical protein